MTLSICIPIFNYDVRPLIQELDKQATAAHLAYEILLVDDGSSLFKEVNRELQQLERVVYIELEHNIGRSAIRNLLAQKAQYDSLLFMDCDTEVIDEHFIERYVSAPTADIIIGGCAYKATAPQPELFLRWFYGKAREERSAAVRNQNPYRSFSAFNCIIQKSVFSIIQFDESLRQYGHEDTLFGWEMKKKGLCITHIDNPAYHLAYDATDVFLEKTRTSLENLLEIYLRIDNKEAFIQDIRILKHYERIKSLHLCGFISKVSDILSTPIHRNLHSQHPSLRLFDLYKLGILCQIATSKNK